MNVTSINQSGGITSGVVNKFVDAIKTIKVETTTTNGMRARESSNSVLTDLFFKIGASRGKDIIPDFIAAYVEDKELTLRIVQWVRDIREGAGERQLFINIVKYLSDNDPKAAIALLYKIPELGRYKDLIQEFKNKEVQDTTFKIIQDGIKVGNGLAAKWTPRKGSFAGKLRSYLELSPKRYRKTLVDLTKVVEQQMSARQWENIEYGKVPSLAISRYNKAFYKRDCERYGAYRTKLQKGEEKVNVGAIYPYDIIKSMNNSGDTILADAQWKALPNYVGDHNILPLVDTSGSMTSCYITKTRSVSAADVAFSLGLYLADKNTGPFKDVLLTFSEESRLYQVKGTLSQKYQQISQAKWSMNTNLELAFANILNLGIKNKVPAEDMPETILILSDMQFDQCARKPDDSALSMIKRQYKEAGYEVPNIVFWNLNASDNYPVKHDKDGTALVSGFSPSIMKSVLTAESFNPYDIMVNTVCIPRYDIVV